MSVLFGLISLVFFVAVLAAYIHGLVLAFSESILLGIIVFLLEPSALIIGLVYWFSRQNLPQRIVKAFPDIFAF